MEQAFLKHVNRFSCAAAGIAVLGLMASPMVAQEAQDQAAGNTTLTMETAPVQMEIALTCAFATECYETEACMDSGYGVTLSGRAGGMDDQTLVVEATLSGDAGDEELVGVKSGGYALSGGGFDARHMLTVGADGAARYTVHYADPVMVISYVGQCLEAE